MKENGIKSKRKAKWKATTNSNHNLPVAPNLLEQDFNAELPNTVWVGDITYILTDEGWLYAAIVKDLCTKDVVGYAMGDQRASNKSNGNGHKKRKTQNRSNISL